MVVRAVLVAGSILYLAMCTKWENYPENLPEWTNFGDLIEVELRWLGLAYVFSHLYDLVVATSQRNKERNNIGQQKQGPNDMGILPS